MKDQNTQGFVLSKFTIRIKLLLIISTIVFFSVSTVVYLATYFFKKDNELRVRENSMNLTNIVATKIESDLSTVARNLGLIASNLLSQNLSKENLTELETLFFDQSSDYIFLGIYKKDQNQNFQEIHSISNQHFLKTNYILAKDIIDINLQNSLKFQRSFENANVFLNSSAAFKFPVLGISIPFRTIDGEKTILVSYMKLNIFLNMFRGGGITLLYLVDMEGNIIAHPETEVVLTQKSFAEVPIVKAMFTSSVSSQQKTFVEHGKSYIGSYRKIPLLEGGVISSVEEDKAFEEVYNLQRRNIYLLVIVLSLSIIIVFYYSTSISYPILKLVGLSNEIEKGNYTVYLPPTAKDELGLLTNSFNRMTKGLDEREKMKDAFGKFVNKELAELAMKGEIKLGGERKYCAIFFSDIRGFTAISESLSPEEVVEFLNQYMTEMVACVNKTNGIVDKFIGDAIMATWGALKPIENETELAINASLMMREALIKFNKDRGSAKKPIIKIGCGINSGYVISGQIGSNERLEYTVIGDAVNLASRVETLNKPFGTDILISEDSYNRVKEIFHVEKMQAIKVKGKSEPQIIYSVLGRFDDPNCIKNMDELRKLLKIEYNPSKAKNADEEEVKYEILG